MDYTGLVSALQRLREMFGHYQALDEDKYASAIVESVMESVIRRFDICHDLLWKTLRRYLHEEGGRADIPGSPKGVFRAAHEDGILSSPDELERWMSYVNARNDAAPKYSSEKARQALGLVHHFIEDAVVLYETMHGRQEMVMTATRQTAKPASIDLAPRHRQCILDLLSRHLPDTVAWAYGSRVKWTSSPRSDLDMVVFAAPEQLVQVEALREALEDSDLPFRVDLFVWDQIPEHFKEHIQQEHLALTSKSTSIAHEIEQEG